jgi:F420-dependent oxidoreductase-like protein
MLLRIFTEPQQGATYDQQLAVARVTEEAGLDAFFRSDHYLAMSGDGLPGPTDSWVTLAALARETTRIRLGTMVTSVTFRHAGPLAISVAQVDQMSGGRIDLGIGTGWFEAEHTAYGIPFGTFAERFELLEETLEVLTGMWSTPIGERFDYAGKRITLVDCPALPKPAQQPRPPIILGGAGHAKTPRLAARFADEFNTPFHSLEAASAQFDRVRAACEAAGRDPSSMILSSALCVCVGRDGAEVERRAAAIGRPVDRIDLAGTPEQVAEKLRAFADAGASRAYLQVLDLDDLDHVRLIGAEVAPLLG